jgi:hypothetical protein
VTAASEAAEPLETRLTADTSSASGEASTHKRIAKCASGQAVHCAIGPGDCGYRDVESRSWPAGLASLLTYSSRHVESLRAAPKKPSKARIPLGVQRNPFLPPGKRADDFAGATSRRHRRNAKSAIHNSRSDDLWGHRYDSDAAREPPPVDQQWNRADPIEVNGFVC